VQGLAKQTAVVVHRFPMSRDAIGEILLSLGFAVLATTDSVDEALAVVEDERPDLLVAGAEPLHADGETGVDAVRRARRRMPQLRAVVLAEAFDQAEAETAIAAGAFAYILETTQPADIRAAIRQGFKTSVFLGSGQTAQRESDPPAGSGPGTPARPESGERLTNREREILRLVAEGRSNGEVARILWVTEQTVKFHLSNIYRKLGVANRTEAGRWAQLTGLLDKGSHDLSAAQHDT
jgi:DNA-binding NarL/FixJ family response regulator